MEISKGAANVKIRNHEEMKSENHELQIPN